MPKPIKLDRDGKPHISEAEVIAAVRDFLAPYRWMMIRTNASDLTRSGFPAHQEGTLDYVLVHPEQRAVFAEFKARLARTEAARRKKQSETADKLHNLGYFVYLANDGSSDPIGDFFRWWMRG